MTPPDRGPMDRARDVIAGRIEARFPGWRVTHGVYGWTAEREGQETARMRSSGGLESILEHRERRERERRDQERERADRIRSLARDTGESEDVIAARLRAAGL